MSPLLRLSGAFLLIALSIAAQPAPRRPAAPLRSIGQAIQQLAEAARPSIVQVSMHGLAESEEDEGAVRATSGVGSGFLVDAEGYILTNAHVVGSARKVEVLLQRPRGELARFRSAVRPMGKSVMAQVVGIDRETDIAVLKIDPPGLPALSFADSEAVNQGDLVLAAGSPFGLDNSVSLGIVSAVARQLRPDDPMIYIQTDAPINPGNSGGPLLDADGAVIGVNTMIVSRSGGSDGVGFSVPSNIARTVYEQIRKDGRVRRGYIGVLTQTITPALATALGLPRDFGAIVADVMPNGAAAAAGVEIKDIILSVDGKPIENSRQFGVSIYRHRGAEVTVELLRAGQTLTKKVAVLERPRDLNRLSSVIEGEGNRIPQLRIFAVDLDAKVTPILPETRKLTGAVVAAIASAPRWGGESLQAGDIVYEVNGKPIHTAADLRAVAGALSSGQPLAVQVERLGQLQFLLLRAD